MGSRGNRAEGRGRWPPVVAMLLVASLSIATVSRAAEKTDATADKQPAKPTDAKPADVKATSSTPDSRKTPIGPGEILSFRQAKIAAEMAELEQRMFRLSESLRQLEPENSSRLMLGLKFAREQLILHQMQDVKKLLEGLTLEQASAEQKQLIVKLERLSELLVSADLDLQMKLQRLREMREALRRLDKAIAEENRQEKTSKLVSKRQAELDELRKRQQTLGELIKQQRKHLDAGSELAKSDKLNDSQQKRLGQLTSEQRATQAATNQLAKSADGKSSDGEAGELGKACKSMESASASLAKSKLPPATEHQEEALAALEREQKKLDERVRRETAELAKTDFRGLQRDQSQNRRLADGVAQLVRDHGSESADALRELLRASQSMNKAESELSRSAAGAADLEQLRSLESLRYARKQLEEELDKLRDQIRGEVRRQVIEALVLMLEQQTAVRESTEKVAALRAKNPKASPQPSVVELAARERAIAAMAAESIALVEEAEFGIALPEALKAVREGMVAVEKSLAANDAGRPVIAAERAIEADLQDMLMAMKQLPASGGGKPGKSPADRERELNRLAAEVKLLRILQVRINRQTVEVDGRRPDLDKGEVEQQVDTLIDRQDKVRGATRRLREQRAPDAKPEAGDGI